jgi:hypothetical protein
MRSSPSGRIEAYLGWCLTILDRVRADAGGYPYDVGVAIPRYEAVTLPLERFGLESRRHRLLPSRARRAPILVM